jgi:hypothetical protein
VVVCESSQVDQVTTLINQEKINREYIFDWSKGGMDVFAFIMTYAGWGLGSDRVLGQNAGWVQFANAFQRTVSMMAKWLLKKVQRPAIGLYLDPMLYAASRFRPAGALICATQCIAGRAGRD